MRRALVVAAIGLLAVRLQFGLMGDGTIVDPLFIAAVHAAILLRGSQGLWLAAGIGIAGDWLSGLPLGLQGGALPLTAYLAFRASRHLMITQRVHLFFLALLLFLNHECLLRILNVFLGLHLLLPLSPLLIPTALLSAAAVAALGLRHEERNPV